MLRRSVKQSLCRSAAKQLRTSATAAAVEQKTSTTAVLEQRTGSIPFPRQSTGLNYALNWALAAKGVPPQGDAYRNLRETELKEHGAATPDSISQIKTYARGSFSKGAESITKAQFNKSFKEVTTYLAAVSKLFVQDGAIGSSPTSDARVRAICDHPSAALVLKNTLCPTPIREASQDEFPLSIYVASGYRESEPSIVVDYDRSALIVNGDAFKDTASLKKAITAFASPSIFAKGALPLSSRLVSVGNSTVIVAAPVSTVEKASLFPEFGIIWSPKGIARFFYDKDLKLPNLVKSPSAFVLVTSDSTGTVPAISKITSAQAAYHYLAGYDGNTFNPAYNNSIPVSVDPVSIAKELLTRLNASNSPSFLVNGNEGEKRLSEKEVLNLIEYCVSDKLLPVTKKKPSENTVNALKEKYQQFMKETFPNLPETITL